MAESMQVHAAPVYIYLRPEDAQFDPEVKPEAAFLLRDTYQVVRDVASERWKQFVNWGDQSHHPDTTWLAILTEEVGESAQAVLHDEFGGRAAGTLRDELVQVAAVAIAWIETLGKRAEATDAEA